MRYQTIDLTFDRKTPAITVARPSWRANRPLPSTHRRRAQRAQTRGAP